MSLREMLSDYWYAFQQELFPRLESELGPMGLLELVFSDIALEGSATSEMTGWAERRPGVARL